MFMCKQCLEQFEDSDLAYMLIAENRLNLPNADMFFLKFCSRAHLQEFLDQIHNQHQRYVLTRKGPAEKEFEPNYPQELMLLIGSSKGA